MTTACESGITTAAPVNPEPEALSAGAGALLLGTAAQSSVSEGGGSVIKVYAAGQPFAGVYPRMDLLIDDEIVAQFDRVAGQPHKRKFEEFTYRTDRAVSASQVKVAYTNDAGTRDLRVDKITINGVAYESEDASTYSTGTWNSATGCNAGHKQSEWLQCDGYFQYAGGPATAPPPAHPEETFVPITVATDPIGLKVEIDGNPVTAPNTFTAVVGSQRSLVALATQTLGGKTYEFVSWSHGADRQSTLTVPASATTYTAVYRELGPPAREGFHVSPSGTANGDGSLERPWNLATALQQTRKVMAGDTVWLAAGTYTGRFTSTLAGTAVRPVVIRALPGARARIDGTLKLDGTHSWAWGVEVFQARDGLINDYAVALTAPGTRLINSVVHHNGGVGVGAFEDAIGSEIYGTLIYSNYGHGVYAQNTHHSRRSIEDNLIFNQGGRHYGVHIYGRDGGLRNIDVLGNFIWHNGVHNPGILYGGCSVTEGGVISDNVVWQRPRSGNAVQVGYGTPEHNCAGADNMRVERNTIVGGDPLWISYIRNLTVRGNRIVGSNGAFGLLRGEGGFTNHRYEGNVFHGHGHQHQIMWPSGAAPTSKQAYFTWPAWAALMGTDPAQYTTAQPAGTDVVVRPNKYEPGRANISVLNWNRGASASVNLSGVLKPGQRYEVRHAQAFYANPVSSGTYGGGSVTIPMAPVQPERTVYWCPPHRYVTCTDARTPPATGPEFNVFVVHPID